MKKRIFLLLVIDISQVGFAENKVSAPHWQLKTDDESCLCYLLDLVSLKWFYW